MKSLSSWPQHPSSLIDIRQTKTYGDYLKQLGWKTVQLSTVENSKNQPIYAYVKKLGWLPFSVAKILRCPWPIKKAGQNRLQLKKLIKKVFSHQPLFVKIQPFKVAAGQDQEVGQDQEIAWPVKQGFRLKPDKHPLVPTKTIWIDLTKNPNQLLKAMKSKTRYNLKKAQQHFSSGSSRSQQKKIKTLIIPGQQINNRQLQSFYEAWARNKPFNWLFKPQFNQLKYLVKSFENNCLMILAHNQSSVSPTTLLAGLLVLYSPNMAFYWHNFSTKKAKRLFSPSLLIWQALLEAKKRKLKIFDLEGVYDHRFSSSQKGWKGFSRFKKGFGGREVTFFKPVIYCPRVFPF